MKKVIKLNKEDLTNIVTKVVENTIKSEKKLTLQENVKTAKQFVVSGKLSEDDLKKIIKIDPTPTRKFVGWMSKVFIKEKPSIDALRNTVEEYNVFLEKGKAKTKDINQFKSFRELQSEVNELNDSGDTLSLKELENDYEVIMDNDDLLIMSPHTHEASRKIGLAYFAYRNCGEGKKDSAWCTTYKSPDHFNDYYYSKKYTFYYVKVKSDRLIEELKKQLTNWESLIVTAVVVKDDGDIIIFDGEDVELDEYFTKRYLKILGIS